MLVTAEKRLQNTEFCNLLFTFILILLNSELIEIWEKRLSQHTASNLRHLSGGDVKIIAIPTNHCVHKAREGKFKNHLSRILVVVGQESGSQNSVLEGIINYSLSKNAKKPRAVENQEKLSSFLPEHKILLQLVCKRAVVIIASIQRKASVLRQMMIYQCYKGVLLAVEIPVKCLSWHFHPFAKLGYGDIIKIFCPHNIKKAVLNFSLSPC